MNANEYKWSFFIAHAGTDSEAAESLYDLLAAQEPTFLDARCIELGADWDLELENAQKDALITVVLVSANTEQAYYQREEIAAAINLARAKRKKHRVVPIFLDDEAAGSDNVPYGLRLKHGLTLTDEFGLVEAAQELLGLLQRLRKRPVGVLRPQVLRSWRPRRTKTTTWLAGGILAGAATVGLLAWFGLSSEMTDRLLTTNTSDTLVQKPVLSTPAEKNTVAAQPTRAASDGQCLTVEYYSPNIIPHYLLNSIGSENFPYWFRVIATNDCQEDRIMTLRFERGNNIALENPPQTQDFTIPRGRSSVRTFNPRFNLASEQPPSVAIHWSIEDENRTKIKADTISTEIVAPLTIAWDLRKPSSPGQHVPVEPEYLLGSMKAWILKPHRDVAALGRACRMTSESDVLLEKQDAIKACYGRLFFGEHRVSVSESPIRFPAGIRQRIRPHIELISDKHYKASSLEAALMFVAVIDSQHKDGVDFNLVMIVAPVEGAGDPRRKTTFVAWKEAGRPWRAIDLRLANVRTFEDNASLASGLVDAIVSYNSEIADAIENKGAGFSKDRNFAAINFRKVPQKYRIRALP